jgi:hypothetical protein
VATTLGTLNANNLFVCYRFGQTFPGDMSACVLLFDSSGPVEAPFVVTFN